MAIESRAFGRSGRAVQGQLAHHGVLRESFGLNLPATGQDAKGDG